MRSRIEQLSTAILYVIWDQGVPHCVWVDPSIESYNRLSHLVMAMYVNVCVKAARCLGLREDDEVGALCILFSQITPSLKFDLLLIPPE